MRVTQIAAHEADFDSNGVDSSGKVFHLSREFLLFGPDRERLDFTRVKPASDDESYFYRSRSTKDQIVLHYTLGYLKGDVAGLTQPDYHVSVPFLIGRNGTIYNLFYSAYWAYHLGPGAVGGNATRSKETIGIELSNIGPLNLTSKGMNTYYTSTYCEREQQDAYVHNPFRRFAYYATFTDAQYESLVVLLRYLTSKYSIDRKFLDEPDRYETQNNTAGVGGIVSHVNYRKSGKEDIGPAFDWDRLLRGVQA